MDEVLLLYYSLAGPSGLFAQLALWQIWTFFTLCSAEQNRKKGDKNVSGAFSHTSRTPTTKHLSFPSYLSYDPVTLQAIISGNWGKRNFILVKWLCDENLSACCVLGGGFQIEDEAFETDFHCLDWHWKFIVAVILGLFVRPATKCFLNLDRPSLIVTLRLPGSLQFPHAPLLDCSHSNVTVYGPKILLHPPN